MARRQQPPNVTEVIRARLRELRDQAVLTQVQLAARISAQGGSLDRGAIAKIEAGQRKIVTVEDLLQLAKALNVSPLYLMTPEDDREHLRIGGTGATVREIRDWMRGVAPLPDMEPGWFMRLMPRSEWEWTHRINEESPIPLTVASALRELVDQVIRLSDEVAAQRGER